MSRKLSSTAVMHRRIEPAGSLDFFPTPPWGTRALLTHVLPHVWPWPDLFKGEAWDPCCGEGHMALVLDEAFAAVAASDIHDYGFGGVSDFLHPGCSIPFGPQGPDWIVMNTPFNQTTAFILKALTIAQRGVAVLARTAIAEGQARYRDLFARRPPQLEAIFVERLPMHRGRYVVGPRSKTATSYAWFVWLARPPHDWQATRKIWIPPCRTALTKPDDWLKFGACEDLPKDHKVLELIAADKARKAMETTLDDVRRAMEALL